MSITSFMCWFPTVLPPSQCVWIWRFMCALVFSYFTTYSCRLSRSEITIRLGPLLMIKYPSSVPRHCWLCQLCKKPVMRGHTVIHQYTLFYWSTTESAFNTVRYASTDSLSELSNGLSYTDVCGVYWVTSFACSSLSFYVSLFLLKETLNFTFRLRFFDCLSFYCVMPWLYCHKVSMYHDSILYHNGHKLH